MERCDIRTSLMDFKNALGICNFSKVLSETEFNLISLVTEAQEKKEHINLTTLSNKLKVTRSAITQITNKLEKKKYIEKYTLSSNKKEIYLKIGKKAIEQYNLVMGKITIFFEKLFEQVGQEGIDNIYRYISIAKEISQEMKKECEFKC